MQFNENVKVSSVSFVALPDEITIKILKYLDLPFLRDFATVSLNSQRLAYDGCVWKSLGSRCGFTLDKAGIPSFRLQVYAKIHEIWKKRWCPTIKEIQTLNAEFAILKQRTSINSADVGSEPFFKTLKKLEKFNNPLVIFALGLTYFRLGKFSQALFYYEKTLTLDCDVSKGRAYINLANMYSYGLGVKVNRELAKAYLLQAFELGFEAVKYYPDGSLTMSL
jgi:tetratricopeptide (TPR) repeat protein